MIQRLLISLLLCAALSNCSWISSWGDDELEPGDPVALVDFDSTLDTRKDIYSVVKKTD